MTDRPGETDFGGGVPGAASIGGSPEVREGCSESVAYCSVLCYGWTVSKTIAQRELRNDNAKVIDAVAAGESFVVTRNGEPVAELRPIGHARRTFVSRAEVVGLAVQGPHIDGAAFRGDVDRVVDQGL